MHKNQFVCVSADIANSVNETDWEKCFICKVAEPKSVTLIAPWNKKGIYTYLISHLYTYVELGVGRLCHP